MFQRFTVVMEYEQKPVLPPPLITFCHIYATCKWVTRNVSHKRFQYDNGLKLFLEKEDMERLYDFEEECVEGYFREQVSFQKLSSLKSHLNNFGNGFICVKNQLNQINIKIIILYLMLAKVYDFLKCITYYIGFSRQKNLLLLTNKNSYIFLLN